MNILDQPLETGSDKKIAKLEKINKNLDTGVIEFETLPKELTAKNWKLEKNKLLIPVSENSIDYFTIVKDNDTRNQPTYYYSFERKENNNKPYNLSQSIQRANFIDIKDIKRDNEVIELSTELELFKDENTAKKFINSLLPEINKHNIKDLLKNNYDLLATIPEDTQEIDKKFKYQTFEDYPENIQKEAIKIIESNKFLDELLNSIAWKHEGDKKTAKELLLSIASIYIEEPVHYFLNAERGLGKTDIFNRVKELQPEQYIVDMVSFSAKYLFYTVKEEQYNELHPKYNILIIDDIKLTNEIIELLKLLLDNEREEKIHKTLVDQKPVKLDLPMMFLGLINRAKSDIDRELIDRCFIGVLETLKPIPEKNVKNKIKEVSFRDMDILHEKNNLILRACYQYLIDKEIKVYNPYLLFFNVEEHSNRNIKHYISLMKAMSFYNYNQRQTIDNTTIGSHEDIDQVLNIVATDFNIQKDKLTELQKRIIDELETNEDNNTYKKLEIALKTGYDVISKAITGRENQLGLEAMEYVEVIRSDIPREPNIVKFKKSYKSSNERKNYKTFKTFQCLIEKNPLLLKRTIIINYLDIRHILINKEVCIYIINFLKNNDFNIDSYTGLCEMIDQFIKSIKKDIQDLIYLDCTDNISLEELKYHNKKVSENIQKIHTYIPNTIFDTSMSDKKKTTKNTLNQNRKKKTYKTLKNSKSLITKNSNEDHRKELHKIIYENVKIKGTKHKPRLIENMIIPNDNLLNPKKINKEIQYLLDNYYIEIDKLEITILESFDKYYNEKLINLKGDLS